ncbi:hypothetical protein FEI15_05225 [Lacticaseibacillus zeae]|uniref:Uncharacterized protein n=1 Tax=Lacticaseibacillus zeae TaxID=57037 RepID=A0A5R8LS59_LACZE|nr:DEAD/DEAH box helicase family protein [Lacticaseibacillus zeae]TLF40035.1 hypothetical protein FEI15_05225 [Lacticaseibacillus zeae]
MQVSDFLGMIKKLQSQSPEHALMLLNAPTGTGKSYTIIRALCRYAVKHENFRAFFVTDQKKNLKEQDFEVAWREESGAVHKAFSERVAVVRSLEDTVNKLINDWDRQQIPDLYRNSPIFKKSLENLGNAFKSFGMMKENEFDLKNAWTMLSRADYQVRRAMITILADKAHVKLRNISEEGASAFKLNSISKGKIREFVSKQPKADSKWLNETYPTFDLEKKQIIILTTAKFIKSYTPFFEKRSKAFRYSPILKDALVVLDEFDSTKKQILESAIDEALKIQADLNSLFVDLSKGLNKVNEGQLPAKLGKSFTSRDAFKEILNDAEQLTAEFKLDFLYKMEEQGRDSGFVMRVPQTNWVSVGKPWNAYFDEELRQVVLGRQPRNDLNFQRMLPRISVFLKGATKFILNRAREYQVSENQKLSSLDDAMTIEDACFSIYAALGLSKSQAKILFSLGHDFSSPTKVKTTYYAHSGRRFQQRGLSLFQFTNDPQHDLQTKINACFFNETPERYLLNLLSKANVLGLSATATLPTVLDNYDLGYLREMLGPRLLDGVHYLSDTTIKEFDFESRYAKQKIQVKVETGIVDRFFSEILPKNNQKIDNKKIWELDAELAKLVNCIPASEQSRIDKKYFARRYLNLFNSFVIFLTDPSMTSFLGLQSLLPGADGRMDENYIKETFTTLKELVGGQDGVNTELRIVSSRNQEGVQEQLSEALNLVSQGGKRVYILSAYQTIGIGQNLQHEMNEFEREQAANIAPKGVSKSDPRQHTIDLAGMYLGEVTHILSSNLPFRMDAAGLRSIIEQEYLFDANEINIKYLNKYLKGLQHQRLERHPEYARSLYVSYSRTIIQALGRMNRSFNKMTLIRLVMPVNVLQMVTDSGIDVEKTSQEYRCLLTAAKDWERDFEKPSAEIAKQNATFNTFRDYRFVLAYLQTSKSWAQIYHDTRWFYVRHPTVSDKDLKSSQVFQQRDDEFGLQYLLNEHLDVSYEVKPINHDNGQFDFSGTGMEVSAEAAGLVAMCRYPGLKEAFESLDIPTKWEPNERILNPAQFYNYRGLLGEVSGQFIFQNEWSLKLADFGKPENYELFDFHWEGKVAIDFKNWRDAPNVDTKVERQKVEAKLAKLQANTQREWRVIIINILASNQTQPVMTVDGKILEISGLIDHQGKFLLMPEQKLNVWRFLNGTAVNDSNDTIRLQN